MKTFKTRRLRARDSYHTPMSVMTRDVRRGWDYFWSRRPHLERPTFHGYDARRSPRAS